MALGWRGQTRTQEPPQDDVRVAMLQACQGQPGHVMQAWGGAARAGNAGMQRGQPGQERGKLVRGLAEVTFGDLGPVLCVFFYPSSEVA